MKINVHSAQTRSAASIPASRHGAITAVVCLALAAVVAAMSSLNVALPDIARSTHASQTQLSWIIDAYSLVFAALLLPAGALAWQVVSLDIHDPARCLTLFRSNREAGGLIAIAFLAANWFS